MRNTKEHLAPDLRGSPAWEQCRAYRVLLKEHIVSVILADDVDYQRQAKRPQLSHEETLRRKRIYLADWNARRAAQQPRRATMDHQGAPEGHPQPKEP